MDMTTGMWFWMVAATVTWTGMIAALIYSLNTRPNRSETPIEVAKRRYAAGEIDREEFNRLTADLGR